MIENVQQGQKITARLQNKVIDAVNGNYIDAVSQYNPVMDFKKNPTEYSLEVFQRFTLPVDHWDEDTGCPVFYGSTARTQVTFIRIGDINRLNKYLGVQKSYVWNPDDSLDSVQITENTLKIERKKWSGGYQITEFPVDWSSVYMFIYESDKGERFAVCHAYPSDGGETPLDNGEVLELINKDADEEEKASEVTLSDQKMLAHRMLCGTKSETDIYKVINMPGTGGGGGGSGNRMPQVYDCETTVITEGEEEEEGKFKGISKFVNCIAQIGGRTCFFDDYEVDDPGEENVKNGIWCAVYEYEYDGEFKQTLSCLTKTELAQKESYEYFFVRPLYLLSGMTVVDMRNMPEVAAWHSFNEEYEPDSDGGS